MLDSVHGPPLVFLDLKRNQIADALLHSIRSRTQRRAVSIAEAAAQVEMNSTHRQVAPDIVQDCYKISDNDAITVAENKDLTESMASRISLIQVPNNSPKPVPAGNRSPVMVQALDQTDRMPVSLYAERQFFFFFHWMIAVLAGSVFSSKIVPQGGGSV